MKRILILAVILFTIESAGYSQQSPVDAYATKVANRMKDSLNLNTEQRSQLYTITKQLGEQQKAVWTEYSESDSVLIKMSLQRIENTRDTLYRPVLGEQKYPVYLQKKRVLINNN